MLIPINTKKAPQPIGPYSQAIKIGRLLILSGQIPIDVKCEKITNDITQQTIITLKNIKSIIEAANLTIKNIIKTTIFLTNMNDLNTVNKVYKNFFLTHQQVIFPARSCVQVSALPNNVKIEIEALVLENTV
ncbi:Rid family detoxifying hydrolase [Buchnera aphidicola]|uniref:Rid family detoxifying hydrolase n=1 Tax=Buchnera aphidicola TaxID=9 RepID=UPI0034643729